MDRTQEYELLTSTRGVTRAKRYAPLDDASSLITKIIKMKCHLGKYGHDYLNTYGSAVNSIMTEERRNKLDQDVEEFINVCNDKIEMLRSEIRIGTTSSQVIDHRKAVIEIMMRIFNDFVNCCTLLRTTRMMRDEQKQKYEKVRLIERNRTIDEEMKSLSSDQLDIESMQSFSNNKDDSQIKIKDRTYHQGSTFDQDDYMQQSLIAAEHHTSISPQEAQMLALENSQIHEELVTLNDEIRMISKKVVQISQLQQLFSDKVIEQEIDLNRLHETALSSSENVREGNDLIRDAMMKNASTRVFILFYIITLGFTILFLDWYNP